MRRTKSEAASRPGGQVRGERPGGRWAVRHWRVRTRLAAILLIPVLVALVLGGIRVQDSVRTWNEAEDARATAELVQSAATYGNALLDERDRTAAPLLAGHRDAPSVSRARAATDRAKERFDRAARSMPDKPGLKRRLKLVRQEEPKLAGLRRAAYTRQLAGVKTEEGYVAVQHPLTGFASELGFGTGDVTSYGRTVYSASLGKAAESLQRSLGTHLLLKPGPTAKEKKQQLTAFGSYAYLERIATEEYVGGGRPQDVRLLQREKAGSKSAGMGREARHIASGASPSALRARGVTAGGWYAVSTRRFDAYRTVEKKLTQDAVGETGQLASDARENAALGAVLTLAALLVAVALAAVMARSMSRGMRGLRTAAFDVAQQRLPALVDQLSRADPGRVDTRVTPLPVDSRDEIGEVARAFDQVHREAVRLASEQAMLRGNVNAIFTNLSRRNQGLIERQLGLISDLENREAEPEQLESLFRLDHLATRMRRNGENLLVLAGEEPGRRWTRPVPLVDVLRAATSEVEHYERIELSGFPESEIHGQVVNDLVHLLAELLENATAFSSPQTHVQVTATRLPDGRMLVEIHDKGIGLTAEDFADINHRLANPPTVDVAVSQRMGLYVVGRLADRHGIRVQLRPSAEQPGTTSLVMLPESITHGGGAHDGPSEGFSLSRLLPEQGTGDESAQQHSPLPQDTRLPQGAQHAQDLPAGPADQPGPPGEPGQTDRPYPHQQGGDGDEFGLPGRSLLEGGRRAALEAQQQPQEAPWAPEPREQLPVQPYGPTEARGAHETPAEFGAPGAAGTTGAAEEYGAQADAYPPASAPAWTQPEESSQLPAHQGQYDVAGAEAEASSGVPEEVPDHVGFDHSGPAPSSYRSTTGAGLPRREPGRSQPDGEAEPSQPQPGSPPESPGLSDAAGEWRSANDERWSRAERLREPEAGGVTPSGLPRRVPSANFVEGTAEQSPQGGPSVSRAPEDVRGRLSNLHRGVRRGRNAGDLQARARARTDQNDRPQGYGPGSTYDQER